jgi:hypothetical protein
VSPWNTGELRVARSCCETETDAQMLCAAAADERAVPSTATIFDEAEKRSRKDPPTTGKSMEANPARRERRNSRGRATLISSATIACSRTEASRARCGTATILGTNRFTCDHAWLT